MPCVVRPRLTGAWLGMQIFEEVKVLEKEGRKVTRFSVTGYSLGGLIARYVVGCVLCALLPEFACVHRQDIAFCTNAGSSKSLPQSTSTPSRLRISVSQDTPLSCRPSSPSSDPSCCQEQASSSMWYVQACRFVSAIVPTRVLQVDKWSQNGRPLLEVMADPSTSPYTHQLTECLFTCW